MASPHQLDLGRAFAAGFARGSPVAADERVAVEQLMDGLADRPAALAVDDPDRLQAGQGGLVQVAVQLLSGLVAALAAQVELQGQLLVAMSQDNAIRRLQEEGVI